MGEDVLDYIYQNDDSDSEDELAAAVDYLYLVNKCTGNRQLSFQVDKATLYVLLFVCPQFFK